MTTAPAAVVVLLLAREGITITPATLRQWRHRGHISPGPGYNLNEIVALIERRRERVAASTSDAQPINRPVSPCG